MKVSIEGKFLGYVDRTGDRGPVQIAEVLVADGRGSEVVRVMIDRKNGLKPGDAVKAQVDVFLSKEARKAGGTLVARAEAI